MQICDDAGGGQPRVGKFPRSMSDFKPGEKTFPSCLAYLCAKGFRLTLPVPGMAEFACGHFGFMMASGETPGSV